MIQPIIQKKIQGAIKIPSKRFMYYEILNCYEYSTDNTST